MYIILIVNETYNQMKRGNLEWEIYCARDAGTEFYHPMIARSQMQLLLLFKTDERKTGLLHCSVGIN